MTVVKARVGGGWVPVSGGSMWDTSWGIVAMGDTTNSIVSLDAVAPVIMTTLISFNGVVGRRYAVKYSVRAIAGVRVGVTTTSPGSSSSGHIDLWIDGANPALADSWFEAEMSYGGRDFEWLFTGDGTTHTYQLRGLMNTGTAQFHNQSGRGNAYFYIEDKGPTVPSVPGTTSTAAYSHQIITGGGTTIGSGKVLTWDPTLGNSRGVLPTVNGVQVQAAGRYECVTHVSLAGCSGGAYIVPEIFVWRAGVNVASYQTVFGPSGYWLNPNLTCQHNCLVGDELRVSLATDIAGCTIDSRSWFETKLIGPLP